MLLVTQWRKSSIPQYLLQLLCVMSVVIQSRMAGFMSGFTSCRWRSRENRKRGQLGLFKVNLKWKLPGYDGIKRCYENSHTCFPF